MQIASWPWEGRHEAADVDGLRAEKAKGIEMGAEDKTPRAVGARREKNRSEVSSKRFATKEERREALFQMALPMIACATSSPCKDDCGDHEATCDEEKAS